MNENPLQTFRAEWHSYQGASTIIEAGSQAEAIEKERASPFAGDDLDLHEELDNVFVVAADAQPVFLRPAPRDEEGVPEVETGRIRKYIVSATYRKIYAGDVVASTAEEAQRKLRDNVERIRWTLVKELQHIVATPVPEEP
jgi:hypothetical protein